MEFIMIILIVAVPTTYAVKYCRGDREDKPVWMAEQSEKKSKRRES